MEALRSTDDGKKRIGEAITRIFDHLTKKDEPESTPNLASPVGAEGGQD